MIPIDLEHFCIICYFLALLNDKVGTSLYYMYLKAVTLQRQYKYVNANRFMHLKKTEQHVVRRKASSWLVKKAVRSDSRRLIILRG